MTNGKRTFWLVSPQRSAESAHAHMTGCYAVFHKQLGDLVLLEPALSRLRDHHGPPVTVLTRSGHRDLLTLMPGVTYASGLPLRPRGDAYCFDPLNKSALRAMFTPTLRKHLIIPERRELRRFHSVFFPTPTTPEIGNSYVAEFFWRNTPVPASGGFRPPTLNAPPQSWAPQGVHLEKPYILVNATAGWRMKMWSAQKWGDVVRALGPVRVILTSGGQDWQKAHCREVMQAVGAQAEYVETDLKQFLWLCANARAVLTVDGSAAHLAAAFRVPSLTLFGPTNIHQWHRPGPYTLALQADESADGSRPVSNIPTDAVAEAARRILNERA